MKRIKSSRAFPNAHVFPGGVLDKEDGQRDSWKSILTNETLSLKDFSMRLCSIRELFEEVNVLLAEDEKASYPPKSSTSECGWFHKYCQTHHIVPNLNNLIPFARWITPKVKINTMSRYDTMFYIVEAHESNLTELEINPDEIAMMDWYSPTEALNDYNNDIIHLAPPTFVKVHEMKQFRTLDDLLKFAKTKTISPILPEILTHNGVRQLALPYQDPKNGALESKVRVIIDDKGKCTLTGLEENLKSWL